MIPCLIWSPMGNNFLTLLSIRKVTLHINDIFGDFLVGWFGSVGIYGTCAISVQDCVLINYIHRFYNTFAVLG